MSDTRCFWSLVGPLGNEKDMSGVLVDAHWESFCEAVLGGSWGFSK